LEVLEVFEVFGSFEVLESVLNDLRDLRDWRDLRETSWFRISISIQFSEANLKQKHPKLIPEGPKSIQNRSQRGARRVLGRSWGPISKKWGTRSVRKTTFCLILSDL